MPELPEVETIRCGIEPFIKGRQVSRVVVRTPRLRWPIPVDLASQMCGRTVQDVERRAKYLLLRTEAGTLLIHLGMSGYLRVLEQPQAPGKHDHADIEFSGGICLRLNDVRRFGALLWLDGDPAQHPLLAGLGPEPLSEELTGDYLYQRSRGRRLAVKPFIMDSKVVVGVGNIYASEALFRAGIDPARAAGRISLVRYRRLAEAIRQVLREAITAGGTTLRDFSDQDGRPGYFAQQLQVYGRGGEPCSVCGQAIVKIQLGQRSTYFCRQCQR
ncbi:DNA-formamidopyrimidine glycosylase [Syntrophotalea acetylenivorans]|uniref:Formamidopyrimidine-DNA glycosylase n=1 Tax=Syntrophotalea acetylenivorans TaxID=1842532 RepID=A0A1L3GMD7_9BACT|nr:bifunctional DNA-formamidopyrimidine glycosylase/DNA-(apurinic or apyrimidinic site) lyase [Syntrophotalea acetylenivorans]APG27099.1 DNA-formamidopyrimidine glycosylase [Syntrophotalea acetylenivorans]